MVCPGAWAVAREPVDFEQESWLHNAPLKICSKMGSKDIGS